MFLPVWNYFRGYVIIKATGLSAGKFINMAAYYGIELWDIRNDGKEYYMKADIRNIDEIKEISRRSGSRTEIVGNRGLPYILFKIKNRLAYSLGALFFISALYALSGFVWLVEANGNYRVPSEDVLRFCEENGLYPGALKRNVDTTGISDKIIADFSDIAWASVSIKGTKASVSVSETIPETEIVDNNPPCDIISETDGIIESITVINGTPLVRAGDVVKKGDILVSGVLDIKDGDELKGQMYVKAEAYIRALFTKDITLKAKLTEYEKEYTGNSAKGMEIKINDKKYDFSLVNDFEKYDTALIKSFNAGIGQYRAPFSVGIYDLNEYIMKEKTLSQEEAEEKARDYLEAYEEEIFGIESYVVNEEISSEIKDDFLIYRARITVSGKIGEEKQISENNDTDIRGEND